MLPEWALYLGTLLMVWGVADYIRDIQRGRTRPNLVTWLLWSLAPLIAFGAMIGEGVGAAAVLTLMVGLCHLAVFIAGLRNGRFRPTRFDGWCLGMSLLALVVWQLTGSGLVGIGMSILADAIGAAPTFRKSVLDPLSESHKFFGLFAGSSVIALLTLEHWTLANSLFTIYLLVFYVALFTLVRFELGPRLRRRATRPLIGEADPA